MIRRLRKEAQECAAVKDEIIRNVRPTTENLTLWSATIRAPIGSVYEGYEFELQLSIGDEYPVKPLTARFETKIFHPNVDYRSGEVCIDILKKEWSPAWGVLSACRAVAAILADPAPDR